MKFLRTRNSYKIALSILMVFFSYSLYAQNVKQYRVSGKVIAPVNFKNEFVSVTLLSSKDSALVSGTTTDSLGGFKLEQINPGKYVLVFSDINLFTVKNNIEVTNQDVALPTIEMKYDSTQTLSEVVVKSKKPLLRRDLDKLIVDVESSIYAKGENSMRLLNIVPGVQVDAMNNIVFRGTQKVTVYVDGRKLLMTGQQLLNYLRTIPSESIKQIELRSVTGAEFDADNTGAIVNIVLKSSFKYGFTTTVGADYQYTGYGNYSTYFTSNYRVGKFVFQLGGSYYTGTQFEDLNETQFYKQTNIYSIQQSNTVSAVKYGNYKAGFDYEIDKNQLLGVNYEHTSFPYKPVTNATNNFLTSGNLSAIDSSAGSVNFKNIKQNTGQLNVFYRYKLDTLGSTLDVGYNNINYSNNYLSDVTSTFNYYLPASRDSSSSFSENNPVSSKINIGNIDLQKNLKSQITLFAGAKISNSKIDNSIKYFDGDVNHQVFDSALSNGFKYKENIFALYGAVEKKFTAIGVKVGLRAENTNYTGYSGTAQTPVVSLNRWDFFPSLFLQYKTSPKHVFNLSYARSISRPSYLLLNPFENIQNPYYIEKGNPYLVPYFSNNVEFSYLLNSKYSFTTGFQRTTRIINTVYQNVGNVIYSTYDNVNNQSEGFISLSPSFKINDWWELNCSVTARYTQLNIFEPGNATQTKEKFSQDFWMSNKLTIAKSLFTEVIARYSRNQFLGIYDWKPQGSIDFSFKKSFFKDKLTSTLYVADVFNIKKIGWSVDEQNFTRNVSYHIPTRYISVGIAYNITQGRKSASRESIDRKSGEELDRLNK
jgi:outer membrane receptor protein involved in Fe transport